MTSPLYRIGYLIVPVCLLILLIVSLLIFRSAGIEYYYFATISKASAWAIRTLVLLSLIVYLYLIHFGEGKEFRRTFPFDTCSLLTLSGLKLMGARDFLSILALTFTAIVSLRFVYCHILF